MIVNIKSILSQNLSNFKGWKTDKKIVIFESDDWGSIRMPSRQAYNQLIKEGIRVDKSFYDSLDALEKKEDLMSLFDLLSKNETQNGKPIFTFNTVLQNPDFKKIKDANFSEFFGMDLFDSYKHFYDEDLKSLWTKGMEEKLFLPQYHAREHLNANLWLKDLKSNLKETRIAFESNFFGLKTVTSSKIRKHYLAAYFSETAEEYSFVKNTLHDGVKQFESLFGFNSASFIACNYFWPKQLEKELVNLNFKIIQGQRKQMDTNFLKRTVSKIPHYTGEKNSNDQYYTVRNVVFEPYLNQNVDWASKAFKEIENAFFWNTPAIVSSHRINYVSNMSVKNRDLSIKHLDALLKKINSKYPDVLFLTSDKLLELMK